MRHGIFRFHPLLWVLTPVIGGIVGSFLFTVPLLVFIALATFSLIGMIVSHKRLNQVFGEKRSVICFTVSLFILFGSLSAFRTRIVWHETRPVSFEKQNYLIELQQSFSPQKEWNAVEARIVMFEDGQKVNNPAKVLLILQRDSCAKTTLSAGSYLKVQAAFSPILPEKDPFAPDLSLYYRSRKILARGFADTLHWKQADNATELSLTNKMRNIQFRLVRMIAEKIEDPQAAALMQAMLLGYKSDLSSDTKAEFRASGLSHILAVSGLHVGIVALLIGWLLFFIPNTSRFRWIKWTVSILLIMGYAALTGFSISVVRASLLFVVLQTAHTFHLQRNALNALFGVALLQLAYNPLYLFDIGFQLSYTAVAAISWMSPKFDRRFRHLPHLKARFLSMIGITIGIQLTLLPLLLFHFHQFPLCFLPANLLILPLLSWVMSGGFVWLSTLILGYEWAEFTHVIEWSFHTIGEIAAFIGQWQPVAWNRLWISSSSAVLLFAVETTLYFYYHKRSVWKRHLLLLSITLALISIIMTHFQRSNYRRIAIYSIGKSTALHITTHSASLLVPLEGPSDSERISRRIDGVLSYKAIDTTYVIRSPHHSRLLSYQSPFLKSNGKSFFIADSTISDYQTPHQPQAVDYLIVTSSFRSKIHLLRDWCVPQTVVISRGPLWQIDALQADSLFSTCTLISVRGADSFIDAIQ